MDEPSKFTDRLPFSPFPFIHKASHQNSLKLLFKVNYSKSDDDWVNVHGKACYKTELLLVEAPYKYSQVPEVKMSLIIVLDNVKLC